MSNGEQTQIKVKKEGQKAGRSCRLTLFCFIFIFNLKCMVLAERRSERRRTKLKAET